MENGEGVYPSPAGRKRNLAHLSTVEHFWWKENPILSLKYGHEKYGYVSGSLVHIFRASPPSPAYAADSETR